jgi:hypothetical protein
VLVAKLRRSLQPRRVTATPAAVVMTPASVSA